MLPPTGICCSLVPLAELTPCLRWALPRYRIDRASWILSQVMQRVQAGHSNQIVAGTVWRCSAAGTREQRLAAAIAVEQAAGAATLLLLQTVSAEELRRFSDSGSVVANDELASAAAADGILDGGDGRHLIRPLLEPVLQRLRSLHITFLQAACDEPRQATLLCAAGFEPLADLSLMRLSAADFARAVRVAAAEASSRPVTAAALQWVALEAIGPDWEHPFSSVAADTFIDTPDCPRLSNFRTAEEIVAGYRTAPSLDRRLSKLLRVGDQWAGCLVLTRQTSAATPGDDQPDAETAVALELTYLGLRPEFRGKRLAGCLLAEAVRVAQEIGAGQILLAVDQQNRPARTSYQHFGWRDVAQESVWGRRV